jgi:hypothetical protein
MQWHGRLFEKEGRTIFDRTYQMNANYNVSQQIISLTDVESTTAV